MSRSTDNTQFARMNQQWLGVKDDGWAGSKTRTAWRERTGFDDAPLSFGSSFPAPDERSLRAFYGAPGEGNLVTVNLPYPMVLAWNHSLPKRTARCHRLVAASLTGALEAVRDHYGDREALEAAGMHLYGGIYNYRDQRGGSRSLSTHAWGIAIDLDPGHNPFRTPSRALAATPAIYANAVARWRAYRRGRGWSTDPVPEAAMPIEVARIFQSAGWTSGGVSWGRDAMHMQATA